MVISTIDLMEISTHGTHTPLPIGSIVTDHQALNPQMEPRDRVTCTCALHYRDLSHYYDVKYGTYLIFILTQSVHLNNN